MEVSPERDSSDRSLSEKLARLWPDSPRWQTGASNGIVGRLAKTGRFSADSLERVEYATARLLRQPLSLSAWDRMTFNDKVTYRRLRSRDAKLIEFSDKLRMRDYAIARLGETCVPKLLRVADRADAFADMTGPFALKGNHGSGWVILVQENDRLSRDDIDRAQSWIDTDFGTTSREWAYRFARRLVYAEELLAPEPPPDYKFLSFQGRAELIQVIEGRFVDHRGVLMRPDWTPVGGMTSLPQPAHLPAQPANLPQMLSWVSVLSEDMDFLRVDLYDLGDRVLVGELTPYPGRGGQRFHPPWLDSWLGQKWSALPER